MKHIAVGGQAIAVERSGDGRPLLLLHGLGADRSQVRAALPPPEGYQGFYPDLPGHGKTPLQATSAELGFDQFAALMLNMLDRLEIERAVIGGISMGSAIALRLAVDAPERCAGLVLVRPSWLDGPARPHLAIVERIGHWQEQAPQDAAVLLEADAEYTELCRRNPAAASSVRGLLTRPQARAAAAVLGAMVADRPFHHLATLGSIKVPALVIGNDGDPLHPAQIAGALARALPGARLAMVPSRYLEAERHLAALRVELRSFLDQLGEY
jgi:pimeloyl-ACP methyl ester carboxylesterase